MKKFLAVLLSVLLVASILVVPASALTWKDNQTQDENGNFIFDNAYGFVFNVGSVNGTIGGEDATIITTADAYYKSNPNWAISVLLAPTEEENVYEVALPPVECPQSPDNGFNKGINFDNGNICLVVHSAYSNPEGANWASKLAALALKVGDKVTLNGFDIAAGTAIDATVTVQNDPSDDDFPGEGDIIVPEVPADPAPVPETIFVDGDLSDNGWKKDGWTAVDGGNGYWQSLPETDTISYRYQFRTDDTKLYGAFIVDCEAVAGGNGNGTNVRFWINTDDEATVYTHFYDVYVGGTNAKYNTEKDANRSANIENSTIDATLVSEGGVTYVEFSIDLAEFNGENGFNYYICVSNKINENVCLYTPALPDPADGENRLANLPYNKWYVEGQATANVEEIKLGMCDADDTEPDFGSVGEEMKELLGKAPDDAKLDFVIEAPKFYKAGDEFTVTVYVRNIVAENGIHLARFNFYYDNEKLLLTNDLDEKDYNVLVCVKSMPAGWENFCNVANDFDPDGEYGTEVNPVNDGVINATVFTTKSNTSAAAVADDQVVFEFTFKALEDATEDVGFVIPHAAAEGAFNTDTGADRFAANGSFAVVTYDEKGSDQPGTPDVPVIPEPPQPDIPENVALGKPYTTNDQFRQGGKDVGWGYDPNAPIAYPDEDGITMTDGMIAPEDGEYTSPEFAGWTPSTPGHTGYNWINIDLGESYDLTKFVLWYGTQKLGNGIGAPASVEIYVSEDGENWGEAVGAAIPANDSSVLNECVTIEANVTARYVQFRTVRGGWVFLTEAEVYATGNGGSTDEPDIPDIPDIPDEPIVEGSYNLVAESTPWEVTGDGKFYYDGDVLVMHANVNWPCIQGYYTEAISVNIENTYLVYDIVVEGQANINFIFANGGTFSFSNSALGLKEGEYDAGSGDLHPGTYTGKIALSDLVKATANLYGAAFPEAEIVDGVLTFAGINVFSVGNDVDVIVNKLALVTEGGAGDEPANPNVEEEMEEALGNAFDDAKFDLVIDAPETYKAGDEINVTVSIKNITAANGLHIVSFNFYYDNEKLVLINDLDENDENALLCIENLPEGWENLSHVANDWTDETKEGEAVSPLNDGVIYAIVFTDSIAAADAITEDGLLVFTFTFKALEDANGDLGFVIPHAEAEGAFNTADLYEAYTANGGYAITHQAAVLEGKDATCTEEGLTEGLYCVNCGKILVEQETIEALGHDLVHHDAKAPTCTEIGWEAYDTCSRCDYTTYVELEALGHDIVHHDAKAPTCTEIGWEAYEECSRCDYTTYVEIEALGHDDGEWVTTVEPTIDSEGKAERRCTVCGTVLEEKVLPALRLLGDVTGDGEIDKYDYIAVKRNVMKTLTFDENQMKAADVNGDGEVDKYDYVLVKRHVMGTYKIEGAAK